MLSTLPRQFDRTITCYFTSSSSEEDSQELYNSNLAAMLLRLLLTKPLNLHRALFQCPKHAISKALKQQSKLLCSSAPRIIGPSTYGLDIKVPNDKTYVEYILERCELFGDREALVSQTKLNINTGSY